jgi:signal transduction histidine kinase
MPNLERKKLIKGQQLARKQLAHYLHDGAAQSIASIAMRLNIAKRLIAEDASKAIKAIEQAEEQARQSSKEIRYLLFAMQAKALNETNLLDALQELATQTESLYVQQIHLDIEKDLVSRLNQEDQSLLFFIALELITIARKKENMANLWLSLRPSENDALLMEARDDGQGKSFVDDKSFETLNDLVELIAGRVELEQGGFEGSTMKLWIPQSEESE